MSAIAAINIGMNQLGFAEEDKRDLYERMTGERSLRAMKPSQQQAVLQELRRLGFNPTQRKNKLTGDYAPKLQALWLSAYNLGIVRDRKDSALLAFVKRQTGLDHTRFLHYQSDARKAIEALKGWMTREAGVDFKPISPHRLPSHINDPRYRVALAQVALLQKRGGLDPSAKPWQLVSLLIGHDDLDQVSAAEWVEFQKKLGVKIRGGKRVSKNA